MDPSVKNLREWVILFFCLFCALDIASVQYGTMLAANASLHPDPDLGQIAAMIHGTRGDWHNVYVTTHQLWVFHGLLASAALALLATLSLIVAHGIRHVRAAPGRARSIHRKR